MGQDGYEQIKKMLNRNDKASHCALCGQAGEYLLLFPQAFDQQRFSLYRCRTCGLCYTFPPPADALLDRIYTGEYWIRESSASRHGMINRLVHRFNEFRLLATVQPLLNRLPKGATILDVGCGAGQLAASLTRKGYEVEVTEISKDILGEIERLYGIKGYCGTLKDIDFTKLYDGIVFNNVLEHSRDPFQELQRAVQLLKTQGLLYIDVPNIDSLQFKLFGKSWFALQIPEHLFHFSPQCIDKYMTALSLDRIWYSTFSQRISAAGYVASIFPALRPEKIRVSWKKADLFLYLGLQILFLPIAYIEAAAGKGASIRGVYKRR